MPSDATSRLQRRQLYPSIAAQDGAEQCTAQFVRGLSESSFCGWEALPLKDLPKPRRSKEPGSAAIVAGLVSARVAKPWLGILSDVLCGVPLCFVMKHRLLAHNVTDAGLVRRAFSSAFYIGLVLSSFASCSSFEKGDCMRVHHVKSGWWLMYARDASVLVDSASFCISQSRNFTSRTRGCCRQPGGYPGVHSDCC